MVETTRTSWIRSPKCATAALTRYGVEDHAVRLLSQGKFTGVVATRTVAESVFLSQLVKSLRDQNVDLDMAAEACHKGPIPSKTSDANSILSAIDFKTSWKKSKTRFLLKQVWNRFTNSLDTEAQLAKAQQKLQQHGIQMTPQRNTSTTPALPTQFSEPNTGHQHTEPQAEEPEEDAQPSNQETTHCQSQTQGRQARQCRQDGHGNNPESRKHDTTGQPSTKPHRHKSDTMVGQHQRQEAPHLCEESSHDANYDAQERQAQFDWNSNSIRGSNGQSPANELQEFIACRSGGGVFCHLTSGSSQFHKSSSFLNVEKKTPFADNLYSYCISVNTILLKYRESANSCGHTLKDWLHLALLFYFGAQDERTQQRNTLVFDSWELHHSNTALTMFNIPFECNIKSPAEISEHGHFFHATTDVLRWLNQSGSIVIVNVIGILNSLDTNKGKLFKWN